MDWQKAIEAFQEVSVDRVVNMDTGTPDVTVRCTWEYIGEGYDMDYVDDDPDDVPLLRFSVSVQDRDEPTQWDEADDASYCTLMPVNASAEFLKRGAESILDECAHDIATGSSYKRKLKWMSWLGLGDFAEA